MAVAGIAFIAISLSDFGDVVKIIGGIILIGYYVRRWYLMEKNNTNKNSNETSS